MYFYHFTLPQAYLFLLLVLASGVKLSKCTNFTIVNSCRETIWPGMTSSNNTLNGGGGFALTPGQSTVWAAPDGWGGRIWARTGCSFDKNGTGTCQTGACGNSLTCTSPGDPPASIAEFTLGETSFYDVSLVDGFNLPLTVTPLHGKGNCSIAGCDNDLRTNCPPELTLKVGGNNVACRSACNVFGSDEFCCKGMYSNPVTCLPSNYSRIFKAACPVAYSYAFDDPTSILTCSATDFVITFCSARNQTHCTFHNNKLECNGSNVLTVISQIWFVLVFILPVLFQFK